jgi:site-specific recombinase XerD
MRLTEAVDHYIATAGRLRTEQSQAKMRAAGHQLAMYCGDRALSAYTTEDLTGFCLGHGGRGDAPNTIGTRLSLLRPFFNWCAYQRLITANPATDLAYTVRPGHNPVREHTWLGEREVTEIARSFNLEDPRQHRDLIVFRTTVMLGMRRSEVASLRWDSFRRGMSEVSFVGKGTKLAELPINATLRDALERWRASQPEGSVPFPRFRWTIDAGGTPRFESRWTEALGPNGIYDIVKTIAAAHGIEHLAPHDLRRSFAGIMENKGVGLRDVQRLMRHEQLSTTDKYMEKNPARLRGVVDSLEWD